MRQVRFHGLNVTSRLLVAVLSTCALVAQAQETPPPEKKDAPAKANVPLVEQKPFDVVVITDKPSTDEVLIKCLPLEMKERRMPTKLEIKPGSKLKLRRFEDPENEYEIAWRDIVRIEFYEDQVLRETYDLTVKGMREKDPAKAARMLDQAYAFFEFLRDNYPETRNLEVAWQFYLFANASSLYQAGRDYEALAVAEELHHRNPAYQPPGSSTTVTTVLSAIANRLVKKYAAAEDYRNAQLIIRRLDKEYGTDVIPSTVTWKKHLSVLAAAKRDETRRLINAGKVREAHAVSREMANIWPDVEGGRELLAEVAERYPLVVVGVTQPALRGDPRSLHNWAERRVGRLLQRSLVELIGRGTESGLYASPVGTIETTIDRTQMIIRVRDKNAPGIPEVSGYDVSQILLDYGNPASPHYFPPWSSLMSTVNVTNVMQVEVNLRRPHVLPEALLQFPLVSANSTLRGPYRLEVKEAENLLALNDGVARPGERRPAEIVERVINDPADPRAAISALRRGTIDVIDRVYPGDIKSLQEDKSIVVEPYAFPVVHMLIPVSDNKFLKRASFRRALVYSINRQKILNEAILRGNEIPGCQVVSGPFPIGSKRNDPLSYAYDDRITLRPYDPWLGAVLAQVALTELTTMAEMQKKEAPEGLPKLVIGYPPHETTRLACTLLTQQLKQVGIECTLKQLPPGETLDLKNECDLLYVEIAMWEPLTDASRLLAASGLVPTANPYVDQAIRHIDTAINWSTASQRLRDLHRICYNEAAVVPLWQIADHFAYRRELEGVGKSPVVLYENIFDWRIVNSEVTE